MLRKFEWEYQQYQNGLIGEADLPVQAWAAVYKSQPLMVAAWQEFGFRFSEIFKLFMDQNILNR